MRISSRRLRVALMALIAMIALVAAPGAAAGGRASGPEDPRPLYREIRDREQQLYLQTLARPDGKEMVYRISGFVYPSVPGDRYAGTRAQPGPLPHGGGQGGTPLFGFEGFSIRRLERIEGTDDLAVLTREIVFYTDARTGEILREWTNPFTGATVDVVPVANDHVNFKLRVEGGELLSILEVPTAPGAPPLEFAGPTPPAQRIGEQLLWVSDIYPTYSLAARYGIAETFGLAADHYTSAELFDFYVPQRELRTRTGQRVPRGAATVVNSWTREGPWVPWMCMAEEADDGEFANVAEVVGRLSYHARAEALDGFADLPQDLQATIRAEYPLYEHAPDEYEFPNATSWTAFWESELGGDLSAPGTPAPLTWDAWCGGARLD